MSYTIKINLIDATSLTFHKLSDVGLEQVNGWYASDNPSFILNLHTSTTEYILIRRDQAVTIQVEES